MSSEKNFYLIVNSLNAANCILVKHLSHVCDRCSSYLAIRSGFYISLIPAIGFIWDGHTNQPHIQRRAQVISAKALS